MITKSFTQKYSDEPWSLAVTEDNEVTVTVTNMTRYYAFSVVTATGAVNCIEDEGDNKAQIEADILEMVHEGHTFHLLDALTNTQAAAYLIGDDTIPAKDASGGIPDYVFNTPNDDDDYVYSYNTQNFVLSIYDGSKPLKYNVDTGVFTMPPFMTHPAKRTELFDGYEAEAAKIDTAVVDDAAEFTAAEITALQAHSVWLKGVRARYGSIDHWKIPCPTLGIPY